ncbi:MAG: hypothetical protein GY719_07485 [bacterium]|nr:hypothetical protein [bacterium]
MKRCLLALAASTLLFQPSAASAEELSARELKKLVKQADKAWAAGQTEQAVASYERILGAVPAGDSRRGEALYVVAMAYLSPEGGDRDVTKARGLLQELATEFPRHPRGMEVAAARALLDELDSARAEIGRRAAELDETRAAFDAEKQKAEAQREEAAGESEAAGGKVKALQAQLRRVRSQLAETQTELDKKEEALQKLKDAMVGRTSG